MKILIDHEFVDAYCDSIIEQLEGREATDDRPAYRGLRADLHELVDRHAIEKRDGHRSQSLSDQVGRTDETEDLIGEDGQPVIDEATGQPVQIPVPQRSDPTFAAVDGRTRKGPVEQALDKAGPALVNSRATLEAAISKCAKAKPPEELTITDPDDIWCRNHLQYGMHEPRGKTRSGGGEEVDLPGGLCHGCYKVQSAEGWLPGKRLLELKAEGKSWTETLLAQHAPRHIRERAKARG